MSIEKNFINNLKEITCQNFGHSYWLSIIPEEFSKQVISYGSIKKDLELVLEYLKGLKEVDSMIIESALTYSIISLYGRCFTSSKDFTQLNASEVFKENVDHLENHKYLKNLRDMFIAHRRKTIHELGAIFIAISKDEPNKATMKFQSMRIGAWQEKKIDDISKTVTYVLNHVEFKFTKTGEKLFDQILSKYSREEIDSWRIN